MGALPCVLNGEYRGVSFLTVAGATAAGAWLWRGSLAIAAPQVVVKKNTPSGCKLRPDLLDERSPEGAEVLQLTTQDRRARLAPLHGSPDFYDGLETVRPALCSACAWSFAK